MFATQRGRQKLGTRPRRCFGVLRLICTKKQNLSLRSNVPFDDRTSFKAIKARIALVENIQQIVEHAAAFAVFGVGLQRVLRAFEVVNVAKGRISSDTAIEEGFIAL